MKETSTISGFSITRELGEGGTASVYLATQHSLEREVALKIMSPLLNSDPIFAARFKREARIIAQLSHASIVPVFDVGEYQSRCYLSMEYLPGGDLKRRLLEAPLSASEASRICIALCGALDLAHRKGFVHRDIKPENILFREDGTPVLTDFGIARALDHGRSMTAVGVLVGTPGYMSPEQVKGLELDGRSDLYSLGVLFHEMLTGTTPFTAETSLSLALKQISDPLPRLPPQYAAYQEFLDCLTAKDREERCASGAEVVRALQIVQSGRAGRRQALQRMSASPQAHVAPEELARPRAPVTARPTVPAQGTSGHVPANTAATWRPWLLAASLTVLIVALIFFIGSWRGSQPIANTAPVPVARFIARIPPPEMLTPQITIPDPHIVIAPPQDGGRVAATAAPSKRLAQVRRERQAEEARLIEQRVAALRAAQWQAQEAWIQQRLIRAKSEYAAGAVWQPAGANAADDYQEILAMRPQHAEATAGAQRVAKILAAEAAQTESVRDIYTSRLLIDRIKMLQPDQAQLQDLQARLEQLLLTADSPGARERGRLERAAKYIAQANSDLGRDPLDFAAVEDATEQYDRAVSVASSTPGLPSLKERLINAYAVEVRAELDNNDAKRVEKLLRDAHKHHWSSADLDQPGLAAGAAATAPLKEADAH